MRPFTFLLGVILGSSASIAFVLLVVDFLYIVHGDQYPRLAEDFPGLTLWTTLFVGLTTASAFSFYGELKRRAWWPWAFLATLAMLSIIVWVVRSG